MPISALSLKFYSIRYFPSTLRRDIPTKAQLDQSLLPTYMPLLDSALPKFSIFAMFIDLLVYSNVKLNEILVNSGPQLQSPVE